MVNDTSGSMRQLGRNALIYGLGVVLSRAASFIMLPIYTRFLTPADYGIVELLEVTLDIVGILLSIGIARSVMRFYFKATTEPGRRAVVSTAFFLFSALNLVGSLILISTAPWIWQFGLKGAGSPVFVHIAAWSFFIQSFITMPLLLAQAQQRALLHVTANVGKLFLQLILNIALVVILQKGVWGVLVSALIANALFGTILVIWMFRETGFRFSLSVMRDLRRFGIPYQFAEAGTFILTFGDRFFLQATHGLAAVGLYSLAYKFGFLLMALVSIPFLRAWDPQRFDLASRPRALRDQKYNQAFLYLTLAVISAAVAICLFIRPLLTIMSAPAFHPAAILVPVIVAAYITMIWADIVQFGILVSERTTYMIYATWIAVVIIVALYALLIPPFGAMGAAVATFVGFAARFSLLYYWSQKLWPVSYHWTPALWLLALSVFVVLVDIILNPGTMASQLVLGTLLLCLFFVTAWFKGVTPDDRVLVGRFLRSPGTALANIMNVVGRKDA